MTAPRRANLIISRRRVADEGEDDDDADAASADYESQSEMSVLTGAEDSLDQGSERSGPGSPRASKESTARSAIQNSRTNGNPARSANANTPMPSAPASQPNFTNTADTDAMINGLDVAATEVKDDVIQFDDVSEGKPVKGRLGDDGSLHAANARSQAAAKITALSGTSTNVQSNETSTKVPDDPAYVPNRGGFFMHDQRNANAGRGDYGMSVRGRGRGRGGVLGGPAYGNARGPPNPTESRWNHDLHESLSQAPANASKQTDKQMKTNPPFQGQRPGVKPPSLSKTTTLGLQSMRVMLLGMETPITYEKVPVKQHVRLPDLRPPLRRDKPVRVSIQDQAPKYIFPSVDRSFIFIPRAQRPNQQRLKGRGYYSPFGSRRNSIYGGGSNYTSSVALSRRSSMAPDGFMSPIDAVSSRPPFGAQGGPMKPVVKLPAATRYSGPTTPGAGETHPPDSGAPFVQAGNGPSYPLPSRPAFRENRPTHIPMHQPRPQKTVSVATIESPPTRMHAPEQQQEQPFHHQVPAHMSNQASHGEQSLTYPSAAVPINGFVPTEQQVPYQQHPSMQSQTPTSAVGNGMDQSLNVNAQQFHPGQSQMVYPSPYAIPNYYYYPQAEPQAMQFGTSPMQAPPMYVQATPQGNYLVPMLAPAQPQAPIQTPTEAPQGMYAQESNGTVFFYDQSQYAGQAGQTNGMQPNDHPEQTSAGMMKAGPDQQMFFPSAPAPMVYYPQQ